jgi:Galactose oxidase, central domain
LLQNGQVLVAGGSGSWAVLASAEIYDPSTGSFHLTGAMSTPRYRHTATLLKDGRVLIAGGNSGTDFLPSTEIYDPATGLFTTVGSMLQAREQHTATLLPNGQVLMTGGQCACGISDVTATAERFDPLTQTFAGTGNLLTQRAGHSAALLADGTVLVAAGSSNLPPQFLAVAGEIYDPAMGVFTSTGAMVNPRSQQTATLLANGKLFIVGGVGSQGSIGTGELYDPASGQFTAVPGSISRARDFAVSALLLSGDVLISGGFDGQIYTPTADLFAPGN